MTTEHSPLWRRLAQVLAGTQGVSQGEAMAHAIAARPALASAMRPLALEQRFMFDGAGAADAAHAVVDGAIPTDAADATADTTSALRHALMAEAPAASRPRLEVVFVDDQVQDYQQLIAGLRPDVEVVVLDGSRDGLQQMADHLASRTGIDAIHVLSHGLQGQVTLGAVTLDSSNLSAYAETLARVGGSLSESGDILLYGCDVGRDASGQAFIGRLAQLTQADVAASTDATGASARGGNWVLEANHGLIDTALPLSAEAQQQFAGRLFSGTITFSGPDSSLGTSVTDGEGYSTDISGVVIELYAADASGANVNHGWMNISNYFSMGAGVSTGQHEGYLVLRSIGSENFSFRGIQLAEAGVSGGSYTFTAYRDGNNVGSVTLAIDTSDFISTYGAHYFSANTFGNVDEIRIRMPATSQVAVNNIVIADPTEPPSITNLNGDSVAWAGVGNTVTLDASGDATFNDADFGALNSGNGNWQDATLTVQAVGGALLSDVFGFDTLGANFTISGNTLQSGGQTFATFTSTGGVLTITFTSSGTTATTALVNDVARHITYRNDTPAGDATIRFSMSDGSSTATADTTVTSDTIYITDTTDTATIDRSNGVSFSEAVAIAAADGTGSQTLVFTSAFSSGMSLAGNLSIAESLTINADSANGLSINGSTITLGGGTTLTFTNASGTVNIASTLAGTGALSKAGSSGTLVLSSTSNEANMSGGITVTGGSLQITNDDQLSSGTLTLNGGTLTTNSTAFTIDNAIAIGASGGTINVGGGGGATLVTLSGVISGSGTLVKNGQAILQLDGNNTYTGAMNITAGTVIANHANAFGTTAGNTALSSGASVRINGGLTIAEAFTVAGAGKTVSAIDYGALHLVSGSSTLSGNITFTGDTHISAASGSALTLSGTLGGGAYNLNKTDAGTLILSNAGNEAGLTGGTTITAGTLSVTNDDYLAAGTIKLNGGTLAITGATTIDNAITVQSASTITTTANTTLSGALSGGNSLTKNGASTLTLAGTSSGHFGALNITAGDVTLSGGSALGNTSAVTISSGTTLTVSSAETIGSLAGAGSVVLNGELTVGGDNTSTTYDGVISGAAGLTKVGSGTQTLTGANSFAGATSIFAGGLTVGSGSALGNGSAVTVSSGATLSSSAVSLAIGSLAGAGTVDFGANTLTSGSNNLSTTFSGALSGSGTLGKTGSGTLTLSGTNNGNSAAILVSGGMLAVASDANLTSGTVTLNNSNLRITGATTIDNDIVLSGGSGGIIADAAATVSGVISGGSLLAKSGIGTLTLTGTNTYSGLSEVVAGTMIVDGALSATSGVNVSSGATLGGSGSIFAASSTNTLTARNGSTLTPGGSGAGALTIHGNLQMNAGSTLALDINGTTAGTQYDQVIVNGTVNVAGATLAVTHAYAAGTGDSYSIIVNDAADAVTGAFTGLSEGGTVTAGGNSIVLTASYLGDTGNDFTLTAPINPQITGVVAAPGSDGVHKVGDQIDIVVNFDNAVIVDETSGSPTLLLETGAIDRDAVYHSGSGTTQLTFRYTVQAGDASADLDYASTTALSLNGAILQSAQGFSAILTLPTAGGADSLGGRSNIMVDGVAPVVTSVSMPVNGSYVAGQNLDFTVNFSEAVTVDNTGGTPRLAVTLDTGGTVYANYLSGSGSTALMFRMVVASGQQDSNGIAVDNAIQLNGGTLRDAVGNDAVTTLNSVGNTSGVKVDAVVPVVDSVSLPANGSYKAGDVLSFTVNTSEAVVVDASGGAPRLALDVGGTTRYATLVAGSSSDSILVFQYTVQLGDSDTNGISVASNLELNGGSVKDAAGNDLNLALNSVGSTTAVLVDTDAPSVIGITRTGGTNSNGSSISYDVTFSEDVSGVDINDFNVIFGGTATGTLASVTRINGRAFSVVIDNLSGAGTVTLALNNSGTGIVDAANNGLTGGLVSQTSIVDRIAPTVTSVGVPGNGTYAAGQSLDFTVNLSADTTVDAIDGKPRIQVTLDNGQTAWADYVSGSGSNALVFRLTVANGQLASDGITVGSAIDLNGAILRNAAGNDVVTTLNSVGNTSGVKVDAVVPVVDSVSLPASGSYKAGDVLSFTVNTSEAVVLDASGGTPRLVLTVGGVTRYASYVSGAGNGALEFQYTVQAGDTASGGIAVNGTLDFNGGHVHDLAGNALDLNLGAVGSTGNVLVDTTTPYATNITRVDATPNNSGSVSYTVTFSENVRNVDASDFNLIFGGSVAGSIESVTAVDGHTFTVKVSGLTGNGTVRLDLKPGSDIADTAGNQVPAGRVGVNYSIDRDVPSVTGVDLPVNGTYVAGQNLDFTVHLSEVVTVDSAGGTPRLMLAVGGVTRYATLVAGRSGDSVLVFQYTVQAGDTDADGIRVGSSVDLNGGSVKDAAGNDLNLSLNNVDRTAVVQVDATAPQTLSMSLDKTALNAQDTAQLTIRFSEAVKGLDVTDFTVTDGVLSDLASTNGGLTWTATLTPALGKVQAHLQIALNNAGYTDLAGNAGSHTSWSGSYAIDTVLPPPPALSVKSNTAGSATVSVDTLQAGGRWEYSLDGGQTWLAGQGSQVQLSRPGVYALQVRQISGLGNLSAVAALQLSVMPELVPPMVAWPAVTTTGWGGTAGSGMLQLSPMVPGIPRAIDSMVPGLEAFGTMVAGGGFTPALFIGGHGREVSVSAFASSLGGGLLPALWGVTPDSDGVFATSALSVRDAWVPVPAESGLVLLKPVPVLEVDISRQLDWQVPSSMFGHSDPLAQVQLSMTLADGRPLPAWLHFDARTGQVKGVVPAGLQGDLALRLTARDGQGREVKTTIQLKLAVGGPVARAGMADQLQRAAQLRAGQLAAQRLQA